MCRGVLVDGGQGGALLVDGCGRRLRQPQARQLGCEGAHGRVDVAAQFQRGLIVHVDVGSHLVDVDDDAGGVGVPEPGVVLDGVITHGQQDVGLGEQFVAGLVAEQAHPAHVVPLQLPGDDPRGLERLDDGEVGDGE